MAVRPIDTYGTSFRMCHSPLTRRCKSQISILIHGPNMIKLDDFHQNLGNNPSDLRCHREQRKETQLTYIQKKLIQIYDSFKLATLGSATHIDDIDRDHIYKVILF